MTLKTQFSFNQLIVTRPAGQATSLISQLEQASDGSFLIQHLPLIQIAPITFDAPDLSLFDGIIFTSGNAAQYFFAEKSIVKQPELSQLRLLAVGESTAEKVHQMCGLQVNFPQQMNAEGVLELPELLQVKGQKWLLVKGVDGRPLIQQTLLDRGAQVTELNVYQRKLPDYATQRAIIVAASKQPVWLITSADALTHLERILRLANQPEHATNIITSSHRIAELAMRKGFIIIAQSAGASEKQLVQCLKNSV